MRNISIEGHFPALSEGKPVIQEEQKDLFGDDVDVLGDITSALNDNKRSRVYNDSLSQDFMLWLADKK